MRTLLQLLASLTVTNGLFSLLLTGCISTTSDGFFSQWGQLALTTGSLIFVSLFFVLPSAWLVGQLVQITGYSKA